MSAEIKNCGCENKGQDVLHGHGKRVFNGGSTNWTCTACGAKQPLSQGERNIKEQTKGKKNG